MTVRFLLVEVRVGTKDEIPTVQDWRAYRGVRDAIGMIHLPPDNEFTQTGIAEVVQVFELTDQGAKARYAHKDGR